MTSPGPLTEQQVALLEELHSLYQLNILTDVVLTTDDLEIPCHRVVLAASSPYFRAMFTNEVRERHQRVVTLHGVSSDVLKIIVGYMYTGTIAVTNENVQDVFLAAGMFEMIHLIGRCADHMIQEICLANCVDLLLFGTHLACTKLIEKTRLYVLEHFSDIVKENDRILDLDYEQLIDLVYSDDISVEREEMIFETIMKWIYKQNNRTKYLSELFKAVRLPLLTTDFIENTVKTHELINHDPLCKQYLALFDSYKTAMGASDTGLDMTVSEDIADPAGLNGTPRLGMFNRPMIIFSSGGNSREERSLTAFDPVTLNNYVAIRPHPTFDFKFRVDHFNLVVTPDNRIYFLGGIYYDDYHFENSGSSLSNVYEYNVKETKWEKRASMNVKRCHFSSCCHGNAIYVTGGKVTYPRGNPTDSVEFYNPDYDYWSPLASIPIKIYQHASCITSDDVMFIFGGQDEDDDYLDTVFRYDIPRDTWTLVTTQMLKPRAHFEAFPYKNKIYLIGGITLHENIVKVAIYEPNKNKWTYGDDFPEERKVSSAAFHEGNIYVCGGVRQLGLSGRRCRQVESRDLYKYEIDKNHWTKVVKLVQYGNAEACAVAVLNTKFLEKSDFISSA